MSMLSLSKLFLSSMAMESGITNTHATLHSDVAERIPEFFVLSIDKIANQLIKEGKSIIKLNLGKSEVPMPKYVADEMSSKLYDGVQREIIDSQGLLPLREEIARDYQENYHVGISADQVFINNGTSPFFLSLFLLLVNQNEEILFPRPYYPTYVAAATMARVGMSFYAINNGRVNLDDIRNNFVPGKTKVVFLNSPGNPLGNVISKEEMKEILDIVDGRAYVISDEIYDGFVYEGGYTSLLQVYQPNRDKVIVLNGFSKIHHMYTRRLGYAIVPKDLAPFLLKYQQHTVVCVDPVTQFGGLISLKNKSKLIQEEIKVEVAEYKRRLETCQQLIAKTKLKIIPPAGSFYMGVDVSAYLNEKITGSLALAGQLLNDIGVAVTPAEDFGRNDFFRVSLTSSKVIEGVEKMANYFEKLS